MDVAARDPFLTVPESELTSRLHQIWLPLQHSFLNVVLPSVQTGDKPQSVLPDGKAFYEQTIHAYGFKFCRSLIDDMEFRQMQAMGWSTGDHYHYRRPKTLSQLFGLQELLADFDNAIEQMYINVAYPGATINAHRGQSDHCWRIHLCLQTNPGFWFNIEGVKKAWTEGPDGMFMFDDGPLTHAVEYDANLCNGQPRSVLILDVKKSYYAD